MVDVTVREGEALSARKWNELARSATREITFPYGFGDGLTRLPPYARIPERIVPVNRDIPPYSLVVPIGGQALGLRLMNDYLTQEVDYYTSTPIEPTLNGLCYITGPGTAKKDIAIPATPIIDGIAYLVSYTGTAPAYADELDFENQKFTLTKTTGGQFKAVADADQQRERVWVIRIRTSGTADLIGQIASGTITTGNTGTINLYEQIGASAPTVISPTMSVTALNVTGQTLKTGVLLELKYYKYCEYPLLSPLNADAC